MGPVLTGHPVYMDSTLLDFRFLAGASHVFQVRATIGNTDILNAVVLSARTSDAPTRAYDHNGEVPARTSGAPIVTQTSRTLGCRQPEGEAR